MVEPGAADEGEIVGRDTMRPGPGQSHGQIGVIGQDTIEKDRKRRPGRMMDRPRGQRHGGTIVCAGLEQCGATATAACLEIDERTDMVAQGIAPTRFPAEKGAHRRARSPLHRSI
jgi:hypothetical protein